MQILNNRKIKRSKKNQDGLYKMGEEEVTIKCPNCGDCDLNCDNCEYCGTVPLEETIEIPEEADEEVKEPFEPTE